MAREAPFARMNGLGNEIIVADMRGRADRVSADLLREVDGDRGAMNRAALRAEAIADDWIATQETHVGVVEERLLPGAQSEGT